MIFNATFLIDEILLKEIQISVPGSKETKMYGLMEIISHDEIINMTTCKITLSLFMKIL